jgi:hypothetical protein
MKANEYFQQATCVVLRCAGNIGIDQPGFLDFHDVQLDCNGGTLYSQRGH